MRLAPILLSLATVSLAAPANFFDNAYDFSDELSDFYSKVSEYISRVKKSSTPSATCDVSKIKLPAFASGLPAPNETVPMYVALGRGTQVCIKNCPATMEDFDD